MRKAPSHDTLIAANSPVFPFGLKRKWLKPSLLAVAVLLVAATNGVVRAQSNYLDNYGKPGFSAPAPVDHGYVEQANGHLHLEIPIGEALPQRGNKQGFQFKIAYDSSIWSTTPQPGSEWIPGNVSGGPFWMTGGGWHFLPNLQSLRLNATLDSHGTITSMTYVDANETTHNFPTNTNANTYSDDASGYFIQANVINPGGDGGQLIYAPDGTLVANTLAEASIIPFAFRQDPNGNYLYGNCNAAPQISGYSGGAIVCDTLGRPMLAAYTLNQNSFTTSTTLLTVPNSQGGTSNYSVTFVTILVKSNFLQQHITDCVGQSCQMSAIQSITLPDGSSYNFKYDCDSTVAAQASMCSSPSGRSAYWGAVTQMTLPTGGQVNYTWQPFLDAYNNDDVWLQTVSSAGGNWTYTPQVITHCSSPTSVGCTQKLAVSDPLGNVTTTNFTLDNGAWPTQVIGPLSTTTINWDFSHPCAVVGCSGHGYITMLSQTVTITGAAGAQLTKKTAYSYDTIPNSTLTQDGLITATKEWKYLAGSNPSFPTVPDRATYTTWYSPASSPYLIYGGTNVHRPQTVTVCNNSGTGDLACPGGGTRLSQTVTTYDGAQPQAISNILNHDDQHYPPSLTVRGNPTQVQHWVIGNTYVAMSFLYDTTGHIIQSTDSAGNIAKYDFTDNYFDDNGTNSPTQHTAPGPTNAFPKTITMPPVNGVSFIETFAYYYGSGKTAYSTDFNNHSTYYHWIDPSDRPTSTSFAAGWNLAAYTSPTQVDTFDPVADANPSTNCISCRHGQIILDGFGRKISDAIMNNPGCNSEEDTSYDVLGRVASVSHPYCKGTQTPVFETYAYDAVNRVIQVTHPDGQTTTATYGASISGAPMQQGSTSTYGYGYPTLTTDEVPNPKQTWADAFGRIIEVDEPTLATSGTGFGTVNPVSGGEQFNATGGTKGAGTFTISGSEQFFSVEQDPTCELYDCGGNCIEWTNRGLPTYTTVYDSGTVSITVNGHTDSAGYGFGSTSSSIASALATFINADSNASVTASASGAVVTLTAKITGASTNYSLTTSSSTNDPADFGSASFGGSPSGSTLTGGSNGSGQGTYDSGTVSISVNNRAYTVAYGSGSTASTVASSLASAINGDSAAVVIASVVNGTINLAAKTTGSGTNYSLSYLPPATTNYPNLFSSPSFSTSVSGGSLTGGADPSWLSPTVTLYTYDAADRLTQVIQGVQTRSYVYDGLGRLTKETTPEAGTLNLSYTNGGFPCSGAFADICQKTDAKGVTTTYCYDPLNRLVAKAYTSQACPISSPAVSYTYDQGGAAANALGLVTTMTDTSGSESYTYDVVGAITQIQKVIGGTSYMMNYRYNVGGNLIQTQYPSGHVVQQSYDVAGKLCEVAPQTSGCGTASNPYATGYTYDAGGNALSFMYGNGVVASFGYSPQRAQLSSLSYTKSGTPLFSQNYWYQHDSNNCATGTANDDGNIQCITDTLEPGRTVGYAYDALGRLTGASTPGSAHYQAWGMSFTYDRYGNRWAQAGTLGSVPNVAISFNQSTNQPTGYTYDANGNLTVEPLPTPNNYGYDAENRLTSYSGGGGSATYVYDNNSHRVQRIANGSTTAFLYSGDDDIAEYDNGAAPSAPSREYVYAEGGSEAKLLAMMSAGSITYYHPDHLSVRMTTDANGNNIGEQGHFPFGESWYQNNSTSNWSFTTYQRDSASGLDYALARFYDSRLGSFCSADPVEGSPTDPQSWNRYAYARDNPVDVADPSGKFFAFIFMLISWLMHIGSSVGAQLGGLFGAVGQAAGPAAATIDSASLVSTTVGGVWSGTMTIGVTITASPSAFSVAGGAISMAGGAAAAAAQLQSPQTHDVDNKWKRTFPCDKSAAQMGQALDKNFTQWADTDVPGGHFSFPGQGEITEGGTFHPTVTIGTPLPLPDIHMVTEVTAHSVNSSGFTFITNPARHIFDGSVDFRIAPAASVGQLTMTISVAANWVPAVSGKARFLFRLAAKTQENAAWKHLEDRVEQECKH